MSSSLRLFKKPEERKAEDTSFLTPSKIYIIIEEFKDKLNKFKKHIK